MQSEALSFKLILEAEQIKARRDAEINRKHFEVLKNHPEWGGLLKDVMVVLGEKINEGAEAEIYDAKVEFENGRQSLGHGYYVVKVMKGDCPYKLFKENGLWECCAMLPKTE